MRNAYFIFLFLIALAGGSMAILSTDKAYAQTTTMQGMAFFPDLITNLESQSLANYGTDTLMVSAHIDGFAKLNKHRLPTVSSSPPGGTYNSAQSITLTASIQSTVYYTSDGSTPTTSSQVYTSPILISTSTTLKFFAIDTSGIVGNIVTQIYVIDIVPSSPTGLAATSVSSSEINLSWTTPNNGGSPITGYEIERESPVGGGFTVLVVNTGNTATTYNDNGLNQNTQYNYRVSAINTIGTSTPSSQAAATTTSITVPGPPTGLTSTAGDSHILLSWTSPSSNGGSLITGYDIYRGTTSGGEGASPIASVGPSITTYDNIGLPNGQKYFYTVSAVNSVGTSATSNEASATPVAAPTVPSAPAVLGANSISDTQINLSWTTPNNGGSPIIGYKIERESPIGGGFVVLVGNTGTTSTAYSDLGLTASTQYNYKVSAINSVGTSTPSSQAAATTQSVSLVTLDKFGLLELHPTLTGGREWWSNWSNGIARTVTAGNKDPYDPTGWFKVTGCCSGSTNPTVKIDGQGVANMSGGQPRMYIYDPNFVQKWHDVEITVYGMRVGEYTNPPDSSAGINIAGRSNHQNESTSVCGVNTYYSRMLYSGYGNFAKELNHPDDSKVPSSSNQLDWSKYGGTTMPKNVWIGHKMILRNVDNGTHVRLEMWRDLTNGLNGGNWQLMLNYTDVGNWYDQATTGCPTTNLNHIITEPEFSSFIRDTGVSSVLYKDWSIREISSLQ